MKLKEYQRLATLFNPANDDITQVALIICELFGYSYHEVDNMQPKKFMQLSKKITKQFTNIDKKPFYQVWLRLNTDANTITLGQFIEIQHWLKMGEIESLHLVAASLLNSKDHKKATQKLENTNVKYVLADIRDFLLSFTKLLQSYSGLFESDEPIDPEVKPEKPHYFIEQYGWIYSAKQVAEFEEITLEQAYKLPIIQALNDLAYLKAQQQYQKKING